MKITLKGKISSPPENAIYIGDRPAVEMALSIIAYDSNSAQMRHLSKVGELEEYMKTPKTLWINISGLKDINSIKHVGGLFNIHPLSIEDILHTEQQPKTEVFEKYKFLSMKTIKQEKNFHREREALKKSAIFSKKKREQYREMNEFLIDQVSMIVAKNAVITFQEIAGDSFDSVRKKLLENIGGIRRMGTDYLAYSIIDAVVDEYFLTLYHLEDDIEDFEERAMKTSDYSFIEEIQDTKKYLLQIKRAILPLQGNVAMILRHGVFFKSEKLKPFLQDLNENLNHAISLVENHREWVTNVMDVNLSVLSHQMNKVMKVLAMISTIFIPLTFIAGIYGMNFAHMPELEQELAYPIVLGGMGLIALAMVAIFKIHRWF